MTQSICVKSVVSSHIYRLYFTIGTLTLPFPFEILPQMVFIYAMTDFFRLDYLYTAFFIHFQREFMPNILMIYFKHVVIDIRLWEQFTFNIHPRQCTTRSMCFASRTVLICMFQVDDFVLYFSPLPLSFYSVMTAYRKRRCFNNRVKKLFIIIYLFVQLLIVISRLKNFRKYFIYRC